MISCAANRDDLPNDSMSNDVDEQSPVADFRPQLEADLCRALADAAAGEVTPSEAVAPFSPGASHRPDQILLVESDAGKVGVVVEYLRNAYPRDVQNAIWKLQAYIATIPGIAGCIPLVAAKAFSPGAKKLLRESRVAYFDLSGTLYLRWAQWLINIEQVTQKPSAKRARGTMNLFTGARACAVHALLHAHNKWLTVNEVADLAQTSTYTCSTVLQELEKREWCQSEGHNRTLRRKLVMPNALLDAWAAAWPSRKDKRSRWFSMLPMGTTFGLIQNGLASHIWDRDHPPTDFVWALTGTHAGNLHTPLLTGSHVSEIIVRSGNAKSLAMAMDLQPAETGANVVIIERDAASLLFRTHRNDGLWIASPFVLYLDLLDGRGRNKELAHNVREQLELGTDVP